MTERKLKSKFVGVHMKVDDLIDDGQYETCDDEGEGWYVCEIKDYDMVNTYVFSVRILDNVLVDLSLGRCHHLESEDAARCTFTSSRMSSDGICEIERRLENAGRFYSED